MQGRFHGTNSHSRLALLVWIAGQLPNGRQKGSTARACVGPRRCCCSFFVGASLLAKGRKAPSP
ncbi:hypothetical protein PCLA_18f0084 [Pseudomonas citronellolis]|nr:hypothetical protein PCLA_18f0084 [Pseudomonas citronellolis]